MTMVPSPPDCSPFRWNAAGWFGAQLGSTCWLLLGAAYLLAPAPGLAAVWLGCFICANTIGITLWLRRDRIRAYTGYQVAFGVLGSCALVAVGAADAAGQLPVLGARADTRWLVYGILLSVHWLMMLFYFQERVIRRVEQPDAELDAAADRGRM